MRIFVDGRIRFLALINSIWIALLLDHLLIAGYKPLELIIFEFDIVRFSNIVVPLLIYAIQLLESTILGELQITLKKILVETMKISLR